MVGALSQGDPLRPEGRWTMKSTCLGCLAVAWLAWLAFPADHCAADQPAGQAAAEPDYRMATEWWSELPKKWTPVGWKNHLFRYNVLFNGAIVAEPDLNRRTAQWAGQGVLLWPSLANPADDGTIRQGWRTDHDAPVLWTDWSVPIRARTRSVGPKMGLSVRRAMAAGCGSAKRSSPTSPVRRT